MKAFTSRRRVRQGVISKRKEMMVSGQDSFLEEGKPRGLIMQSTSLPLTRKFEIDGLRVTFLGEVKTTSKSGCCWGK